MRRLILPTVFLTGLLLGGLLLPRKQATPPAQALPPGIPASNNVVVDEMGKYRLSAGGNLYDQTGAQIASPPYAPDGAWLPWPPIPLMSYGDQSTFVKLRATNGTLQAITTNGRVWNTGVAPSDERMLSFSFDDTGMLKPPYNGSPEVIVTPGGVGVYNVTYAPPFPYTPVVTATPEFGGVPVILMVSNNTQAGCRILQFTLGGAPVSAADVNVTVVAGMPQ